MNWLRQREPLVLLAGIACFAASLVAGFAGYDKVAIGLVIAAIALSMGSAFLK